MGRASPPCGDTSSAAARRALALAALAAARRGTRVAGPSVSLEPLARRAGRVLMGMGPSPLPCQHGQEPTAASQSALPRPTRRSVPSPRPVPRRTSILLILMKYF